MRKYLVRKNIDGKNFDASDIDPLNAPERSVFFEKTRSDVDPILTMNEQKISPEPVESHISTTKQKVESSDTDDVHDTMAKKLFHESFSAIDDYNDKKMKKMYQQLEDEKKLSSELNQQLSKNLSKITKVEVELVQKKNELEKELDKKTKQLLESERFSAIGEFSARLAHDMRNPLSILKMSLENFKALYGTDENKQKTFERMEHAINRMSHQVDGVLDYVRKTPIHKNNESLSYILRKSLLPINVEHDISIEIPENDVSVNCDQMKMEIVFGNLLLNAIQEIGADKGKIIITFNETSDSIQITIQDSGNGISDEHVQKMFDPLFTTKQEGTGLGLPSVKNVLEQHNGTISFSNDPSTFTISLPK